MPTENEVDTWEDDAVKQMARIENWAILNLEPGRSVLVGQIKDHPKQDQFKEAMQHTSLIVKLDETAGMCETRNTIYALGKKYESA